MSGSSSRYSTTAGALTRAEREALVVAAKHGEADDAHWRSVARQVRRDK